jgi:hypothetical protein
MHNSLKAKCILQPFKRMNVVNQPALFKAGENIEVMYTKVCPIKLIY